MTKQEEPWTNFPEVQKEDNHKEVFKMSDQGVIMLSSILSVITSGILILLINIIM